MKSLTTIGALLGLAGALALSTAPSFAATDASETTTATHHVRHAVHHAHRHPVGAAAADAAGAASEAPGYGPGAPNARTVTRTGNSSQCWITTGGDNGYGYMGDCKSKGATPTSPYSYGQPQ
jgi:hypothetical protein